MKNISFLFCAFLSRFIITLFLSFFTITSVNASNKDVAISSSPSPSHPAKGINFFYLDGRDQEDLVQIAEKLFHGDDACKGTRPNISKRFENTLKDIKKAGFEWVRLLISKDFYQIYANRCGFDMKEIYPVLADKHVSVLTNLIENIAEEDFRIEVVLSGTKWFKEPENDILFFESILLGIPSQHINMVMLGGDVQPANAKYQAEWLKKVLPHFLNHEHGVLKKLNYLFDTVTYRNTKQAASYVAWVTQEFPSLKYLPVNLYNRSLPPGSVWQEYAKVLNEYMDIYRSAGRPLWIDEYGFRLSNTSEKEIYTEADRVEYLKGFNHALFCAKQQPAAHFIWTAGNDRYNTNPAKDHDRTPFGLFEGYTDNMPVTGDAWSELSLFNKDSSYCERLNEPD
ncbi:hypothetical protein ACZ81_17205 [Alteromonas macleodii]|uniref:hypothetical protein n=1 Tax=Alteromonas macleodii TaxID=28108 RepID=UPI0007777EFC|nr:hypothetical protein [Alteromonas macleodii]AMN13165.1 hypothetical protein ACZ81_17205 [Alteromonas macleodii]MBL3811659.1 hypothetical protein [Alteromonas macleodii]MBL3885197.1 hypothetical protein [Alteromonas macleodii]